MMWRWISLKKDVNVFIIGQAGYTDESRALSFVLLNTPYLYMYSRPAKRVDRNTPFFCGVSDFPC